MPDRKTHVVTWVVDGKQYPVDLYDIDGIEWRDAKRVTGLNHQKEISVAAITGEFGAIAAVLWIWRRRDEPKLSYEDVLKEMRWGSMIQDEEGSEEADFGPPA